MPKGGRRPGAGRKKGSVTVETIDKQILREQLRKAVAPHIERMTRAQVEHAAGISYMVLRHPDGTFTRATDVEQLDAALAGGEGSFQIFTQAPNTQAYTALLDRTIDKPTEQLEVAGKDGSPLVVTWKKPQR